MNRIYIALLVGLLMATPSLAQFQFPGYLPSQCLDAAAATLTGAPDAKVIGAVAVGVSAPIGQTEIDLGMNMDDGTAPLWAYLVYSKELDTVSVAPLVRIFNNCTLPPVDDLDPGFDDTEGLQLVQLPDNFVEGTELTGKLKANGDYQEWAMAHPDSAPSVIVLATSDEDFLDFPAGTPFWAFNWFSGEPGGVPFLCLVHATTGQTICFGEDIVSVDDQGDNGVFALAPNPATSDVVVSLPEGWQGRNISVDAVNLDGRVVSLYAGTVSMQQLFLSTHALSTGTWQVRISDGHSVSTMPLTIMH